MPTSPLIYTHRPLLPSRGFHGSTTRRSCCIGSSFVVLLTWIPGAAALLPLTTYPNLLPRPYNPNFSFSLIRGRLHRPHGVLEGILAPPMRQSVVKRQSKESIHHSYRQCRVDPRDSTLRTGADSDHVTSCRIGCTFFIV
jgi:hypothetical protein